MENTWIESIIFLSKELEAANASYCFLDSSALLLQGVEMPVPDKIHLSVQWDHFPELYNRFLQYEPSEIEKKRFQDSFSFICKQTTVVINCFYNTVVKTDPERVSVFAGDIEVWVKSVDAIRRKLRHDDVRMEYIQHFFASLQKKYTDHNASIWNTNTYAAWIARHGEPIEVAQRIKQEPLLKIFNLYEYLGDLQGKKVANLLGSHGIKAAAMASLGAHVTVVDISHDNQRYALEVAEAANVNVNYIVSDILEIPKNERTGDYDIVLMEFGIMHYFVDLKPVVFIVKQLLKQGGRIILQDFHPVSTKLITSKGKKHKVTGNYFENSLEISKVSYSKHLTNQDSMQEQDNRVFLRKWTLGEIVTAFAEAEMFIRLLKEEPNNKVDDTGIPKTYTLIAEKI